MHPLAIIGPGKVGTAVGAAAARAGWPVVAVAGRSTGAAEDALAIMGLPGSLSVTPAQAARAGQLVLLTVRDEQIAPLCAELAEAGAFQPGSVVAHCCGALDSSVLAPAARAGCHVGSMHPLQTFPSAQAAVDRLTGSWCFLEGDEPAVAALEALARAIGCRTARLAPGAKALYHAAAVTACNYLSALMDAALQMMSAAGVDEATAWPALEPMVAATLANISASSPAAALTGPVARGEIQTVRRHLAALADMPPMLDELYRSMGRWTADLARRKGTIDPATAREIQQILAD